MPDRRPDRPARAWFAHGPGGAGPVLAQGLTDHADDARALDGGGFWAVLQTFEGRLDLWRMDDVRPGPLPAAEPWSPQAGDTWTTSLGRTAYVEGVHEIRRRIREGEVYQVNLCRVLQAGRAEPGEPWALAAVLARGNPAPYAAVLDLPAGPGTPPAWVVSASPELFLARDGDQVVSAPVKGTGATAADLLPKDDAENVMITDLVRNDLQHVCRPGTVEVTSLLAHQAHPGLVHLVSTVEGTLEAGVGWAELLAALSPPGSVSGAPKSSALRAIADLEPVGRGPYCGAVGWVDADARQACLAVGIRTFWWQAGRLHLGTGAGITWGSDAVAEWDETQLKAGRLLGLAAGHEEGTRLWA